MVVARRARRPLAHDSATIDNETSAAKPAAAGPRLLVVQSCPVTPAGRVGETAVERGAILTTVLPHQG